MNLALLLAFLTALDFGLSQGLWYRHCIDLNDSTLFWQSNWVGFVTLRHNYSLSRKKRLRRLRISNWQEITVSFEISQFRTFHCTLGAAILRILPERTSLLEHSTLLLTIMLEAYRFSIF